MTLDEIDALAQEIVAKVLGADAATPKNQTADRVREILMRYNILAETALERQTQVTNAMEELYRRACRQMIYQPSRAGYLEPHTITAADVEASIKEARANGS
jgi:hypothetical protein